MRDFKVLLSLLLSVLSLTSCIVDCDRSMTNTQVIFTNYTDSTVAIFLSESEYPMVVLEPQTTRNCWVNHEPEVYNIKIGNRMEIDSLYAIKPDSVNVFKDKITKNYTLGKGKCKTNKTDIQYFVK